jgi:hypothetical protein
MSSTLFYLLGWSTLTLSVLSAVFYQDQSKRKETRMIHFYVRRRFNHNFQDKLLGSEAPIVQTWEDDRRAVTEVSRMDGISSHLFHSSNSSIFSIEWTLNGIASLYVF